jgi:hypothetical protein
MVIGVGGSIQVFGTRFLRNSHRKLEANCGLLILPAAKFTSMVMGEARKGLRLSALGRVVAAPIPRFMLWSMVKDGSSMCF